jgi:glycosyltransferase involved in cell wall biosynthesis
MKNTKCEYSISLNVTAHKEGYYLFRTLKSVVAMCSVAESAGISILIQIHLDKPDHLTAKIANEFIEKTENSKLYINHFGDPSASRNFLISKTNTKYALFVDGDDLFTENFIKSAYDTAENFKRPCVVSAEDIVKFDESVDICVFREESTIDNPGIKSAEFEMNLFISQNFVSTEILHACAYEPNKGNYGFEDWHWNTKVLSEGYEFLVAKDTVFFYRQKPAHKSVLKRNVNSNTVIRPTSLFDPKFFVTLPHDKYIPVQDEAIASNTLENSFKIKIRTLLGKTMSYESFFFRVLRKNYRIARRVYKSTKRSIVNVEENDRSIKDEYEQPYELNAAKKALWAKMNAIEPVIRVDDTLIHNLKLIRYAHRHSLATTYYKFCEEYGEEGFTDVIFVPWINAGGADLAMLDLARELVQNGGRVLILTTTGIESQWAEKARAIPGVVFIQSHDSIFRHLDHINIKLFFLRLIQNWKISSMTVMNSSIGFELIERFSHTIKDTGCRIIVHNYAFPVLNGQIVDAFPSLTKSLDQIDTIIVDSQFHRKEIHDIYGVDLDKIIEVPLTIADALKVKSSQSTRRVLFANRIAREKQPQIAIAAAKLLENDGIKLDIYGARDEAFCSEVQFDGLISDTNNVLYKGTFSTSKELDFDQYDICFMPSLYEGTPRIVLESVRAGLYIVCSNTGGMPEVVTSPHSGVVLPTAASATEYADAIRNYYSNEELQDLSQRKKANKNTIKRHSDEFYANCIKDIYRKNLKEAING